MCCRPSLRPSTATFTPWHGSARPSRNGGTGPGFLDGNTIHVTDNPLQFGGTDDTVLAESILAQIGQFWTGASFGTTPLGASRFDQFTQLSGWTSTEPANLTDYVYSANGGQGGRWYLKSATFTGDRAKTNELQDFTESFAAFFARKAGWAFYDGPGATAVPAKMALFQAWFNAL